MSRFNVKEQVHNPMFWISLISIVFAAAGIDLYMLTSWSLLLEAIMDIAQNPVSVIAVITAVVGVLNDNSTPGLNTIERDI